MIGTLLLLVLLSGFIIVEKNTRYIAFGDTSPFFSYSCNEQNKLFSLSVHFMGNDYKISV